MGDEWEDEPPVAVLADEDDERDSTGVGFADDPLRDDEIDDLLG